MYRVSAQGVDERMINVYYCIYFIIIILWWWGVGGGSMFLDVCGVPRAHIVS